MRNALNVVVVFVVVFGVCALGFTTGYKSGVHAEQKTRYEHELSSAKHAMSLEATQWIQLVKDHRLELLGVTSAKEAEALASKFEDECKAVAFREKDADMHKAVAVTASR